MSDASGAMGLDGPGRIVESLGRAWTLHDVGPAAKAKFCAWLKARAARAAQGNPALQGALVAQVAAGAYSWGSPLDPKGVGEAVSLALGQQEGYVKTIGLLMETAHGVVPDEDLAELVAGNPQGFADAFTACLGAGDPNAAAPPPGRKTEKTQTTEA